MMEEVKKGLKLIKYGSGLKLNIAVAIGFLVLGSLMLCIGPEGMFTGVFYIIVGPSMLLQLECSLLYSAACASSGKRKLLEITLPDFFILITAIVGYVAMVGVTAFWSIKEPTEAEACMKMMLVSGFILMCMLIYFGVAYKYFVFSIIAFIAGLLVGMLGGNVVIDFWKMEYRFTNCALLCLVFVTVGVILSCVLRRVLYRKPVSSLAAGANLRKALQ